MKRRNLDLDKQALKLFKSEKVLTIDELANVLNCSLITVRRRLKEWKGFLATIKTIATILYLPSLSLAKRAYGSIRTSFFPNTVRSKKPLFIL